MAVHQQSVAPARLKWSAGESEACFTESPKRGGVVGVRVYPDRGNAQVEQTIYMLANE